MHVKFPSIEGLRNIKFKLDRLFQRNKPTLTFRGTVKLHGTNAAIVRSIDGTLTYQSRDRQLQLSDDLFGFMGYMTKCEADIHKLFYQFADKATRMNRHEMPSHIAVFGEWAGGSIQKTNIAVRSMEKIWAIVGVRLYYGDPQSDQCHSLWLKGEDIATVSCHQQRIFNISEFGVHYVTIDFNGDWDAIQKGIQERTDKVDAECPIGRYFGKEGHGEGLVWQCITPGFTPNEWQLKYPENSSYDMTFKSKGEKHEQSKVKELTPIDAEHQQKIQGFVAYAVTEVRMQQGLHKLTTEINQPLTPKIIGQFIKWVFDDVIKEEGDVAAGHGIANKELGSPIAEKAKTWFFEQLEQAK